MNYNKQSKEFRERYLKETEETGKRQRNYAVEKEKERTPKYAEGWKTFAAMVPPDCVEFLKRALESYKKRHPQMFDIDTTDSGEESGKESSEAEES